MKEKTRLIGSFVSLLIITAILWLVMLPPFNIKDGRFLFLTLFFLLGVFLITVSVCGDWWFDGKNDFDDAVLAILEGQGLPKILYKVEWVAVLIFGVLSFVKLLMTFLIADAIAVIAIGVALIYWIYKAVQNFFGRRRNRRYQNRHDQDEQPKLSFSERMKTKWVKILSVISSKEARKKALRVLIAICAVLVIGYVCGIKPLRARDYHNILRMNGAGTVDDIPSDIDRIAIMDTECAKALGDTEIGEIPAKSQFEVSDDYVQLNVNGKPIKVAPLKYAGIDKWWFNRNDGIPGYVEVDPVVDNGDSRYVPFSDTDGGMTYENSAALWDNVMFKLRLAHPTMLFCDPHLEIDDEGNKWIIAPVYDYVVGLFGGKDMIGAVIVNPFKGKWEENYYTLGEIPEWVDYIFDGDLLCDQYNYYGSYANGYLNSIWGQRDCMKITDGDGTDYGYITTGNDISIYTGVKSVTKSKSDHGFLVANERTGEAIYIEYPSIDEFAGMHSAEQEAREKGYTACFPSLTKQLINGQEYVIYFGALKDNRNFIKRYFVVDANQGSITAVGDSRNAALASFADKVGGFIIETDDDEIDLSAYYELEVTIDRLVFAPNGVVYLVTDDFGRFYSSSFKEDYVLLKDGYSYVILTDGVHFYYEIN